MFRKMIKFLSFVGVFCASFFAHAGSVDVVEPNKVLMFFLPSTALTGITTTQPTGKYTTPAVLPYEGTRDYTEYVQEDHGMQTPAGLVLSDKQKKGPDVENLDLTTPAKVLITAPFAKKTAARSSQKKLSEVKLTTEPFDVSILPLEYTKEMLKRTKNDEKTVSQDKTVKKKTVRKKKKKSKKVVEKTASWALKELENCAGDVETALSVLAKNLDFETLPDSLTSCTVFDGVAKYLKKCHPYPVVYYTPTNAAVERSITLQKSVDLLTAHYSRKTCSYLDLSRVNFEKAEFYKSSLDGIDFSESYFNFATFMDSAFTDTIFKKAFIDNALIQNSDFTGAYFKEAVLTNSHVQKSDMKMTNFDSANLVNTQFRDVNLEASSFDNAAMANTLLKNVSALRLSAKGADFTRAVFSKTVFTGADAVKADFSNIVCNECVFDYARLSGAWFYQDLMVGASFKKADLQEANFTKTRFEKTLDTTDANLYRADVSDVNMNLFSKKTPEELRLMTVNRTTVFPQDKPFFEEAFYDTAIFEARRARPDFKRWECSRQTCSDRLSGRASNRNLAVRAMTVLSDKRSDDDAKAWAICTVSCIAQADKSLAPSQIETLTNYVRREKPWSHDMLQERPENQTWGVLEAEVAPDIQQILYILMNLSQAKDFGYDIDLSGTDLRGTDLSGGDFEHFNFQGANLSMANMQDSLPAASPFLFDNAVFDEYTVFPQGANVLYPYRPQDKKKESPFVGEKVVDVGWNMTPHPLLRWSDDSLKAWSQKHAFFGKEVKKTSTESKKEGR